MAASDASRGRPAVPGSRMMGFMVATPRYRLSPGWEPSPMGSAGSWLPDIMILPMGSPFKRSGDFPRSVRWRARSGSRRQTRPAHPRPLGRALTQLPVAGIDLIGPIEHVGRVREIVVLVTLVIGRPDDVAVSDDQLDRAGGRPSVHRSEVDGVEARREARILDVGVGERREQHALAR